MKFDAVGLFVIDLPRMVSFYRDVIGMQSDWKGINGTMELAYEVEDFAAVDREYKRVVELGATPIMPPTTEPWGQRTCYVADPDGNLVEIGSFKRCNV